MWRSLSYWKYDNLPKVANYMETPQACIEKLADGLVKKRGNGLRC
jgi:hypothetical protein